MTTTAKSSNPHCAVSLSSLPLKPIVVAIICAGYGSLGHAQAAKNSSAPAIETVEVTGKYLKQVTSPKFTAPLLDTPQTLQIIPRDVFVQQGAVNLTDVLRNTPSISFNAGENGFSTGTTNFSLRGFDTSGSIFIDGARDSGTYARDVFNVEQVEVAKGPAADNGRGSGGGYINIVTKTPYMEDANAAMLTYGFDNYDSDPRQRATADINRVVADGTAVRLNLMVEESGIVGRDLADRSAWGVAPSITTELGADTRFIASYQHLEEDGRPDWGVPAAMIDGMMRYDATAEKADQDNYYGLKSDYDDTTSDSFLARFEHEFSETLRLSNQTRYAQTDREARFTPVTGYDAETQLVASQTQIYDRGDANSLTNLTNLSAQFQTGFIEHTLSAGIELTREESNAHRYPTNNTPDTNIFHPDPHRAPAWPLNPTQTNDVEVNTYAIYVYDTLELTEQWQVTGGLRAENYDVTIDSDTIDGSSEGAVDGYDESENTLGGKVGLVYKPLPNGSIYTAWSRATLPAGSFMSNPDISRTGDNAFPGFVEGADPLEFDNYEIGTKWTFYEGRLITTLAYFYTEKRNAPITGRDEGETTDSLKGYGKQIVDGFEFSVAGQLTEQWSLFGGFVKLDSERKHSAYLDEVRRRANPSDYGDVLRTSGDELAFTPNESASLWTTYDFDFGLTIGGGIWYVSDAWLGRPDDANRIIPNGTFGELPGYTVGNLMASYRINDHINVRFNIDNVTDELYAVSSNWAGQRATLGPARSYLLSADIRF